jgi:cyanate lyase
VNKSQATQLIQDAMQREGVTFEALAAELGRPPLWTAAAAFGQHPFPSELAQKVVDRFGLPEEARPALEAIPNRGSLDAAVPTDPTIYRLYELLQVYGPALKALIHEEFGDGIMSAINFNGAVERVENPDGDRVRITIEGKFLPYQWS